MKTLLTQKELTKKEISGLFKILKERFETNLKRHESIDWSKVSEKLEANPEKLWSLYQMEATGGEPDVVGYDKKSDSYIFIDCSEESPKGRRSYCYDIKGQMASMRKPQNNAVDVALEMGIDLITTVEYRQLQELGEFDTKTSSWLKTPDNVRSRGGAVFGDFRYDEVFIYHNSAQSYYISRGFRGVLRV